MSIGVVIVAAGKGTRLSSHLPKQYLPLGHQSILKHTIDAFLDHDPSFLIQVVISDSDQLIYEKSIENASLLPPVVGCKTRQESVFNGLKALEKHHPDYVLIHDAARPFIKGKLISDVLRELNEYTGAIPAIPIVDTIKREGDGQAIETTIDRQGLWRAQTPQAFHFGTIFEAHQRLSAEQDLTDDASLLEKENIPIKLVMGCEDNFKITTAEDYKKAQKMTQSLPSIPDVRLGHGVDVHATEPGEGVWLLGIFIPASFRLIGHSDADVGLHSLCDAIFGAISDGDIGQHFPPTDPQWKGADSKIFLQYAGEKVKEKGAILTHVDVTILGECPKISPHRQHMQQTVAQILKIDPNRVSIKATTTEKLGFIGRGEGLMAMATATVVFPS